jgi:hypothetical protein
VQDEREAVANIAKMLERRARILDEIGETLEELHAQPALGDSPSCCFRGCAKCKRG